MASNWPADTAGGWQSAEAFAAQLVSSRLPPNVSAEIGRDINRVVQLRNYLEGDAAFQGTPLHILGGLSLKELLAEYNITRSINYARKNFFYVTAEYVFKETDAAGNPVLDNNGKQITGIETPNFDKAKHGIFNFFAIDVEYSPFTIASDGRRIGMATLDEITGTERTDLRLTVLDNTAGSIKKWFRTRSSMVADSVTGYVGLPFDYLIKFNIYHATAEAPERPRDNSGPDLLFKKIVPSKTKPYIDTYNMRPTSISYELSRRESGVQEIQMSFTQMDTFMSPGMKLTL